MGQDEASGAAKEKWIVGHGKRRECLWPRKDPAGGWERGRQCPPAHGTGSRGSSCGLLPPGSAWLEKGRPKAFSEGLNNLHFSDQCQVMKKNKTTYCSELAGKKGKG